MIRRVLTAQYILGIMYANGQGLTQNDAEAVKWYSKAAEQGLAQAQHILGVRYAKGEGVPQDDTEAVRWWIKAAEQGDADAQVKLGIIYSLKHGFASRDANAEKWMRKAADQGIGEVQFWLGIKYANGEDVPQSYTEAVNWYRKAAEQGHIEARNNLRISYGIDDEAFQRGVQAYKKEDYLSALRDFMPLAEYGNAKAQFIVGSMCRDGEGVLQDYAEAAKWFSKSAEQGDSKAKAAFDSMLAEGLIESQGNISGSDNLGVFSTDFQKGFDAYKEGDYPTALRVWRPLAEQGYAAAQFNLGHMYANGSGVPQDNVMAYVYFNLAAALGNTDAINEREVVAEKLSLKGIAEAQAISRSWKPGTSLGR